MFFALVSASLFLFIDDQSMFVIFLDGNEEEKRKKKPERCDDERVFYLRSIWAKCIVMNDDDAALG